MLHLVGSSILLHLIDDARSNKNKKSAEMYIYQQRTVMQESKKWQWIGDRRIQY